MGYCGFRESLDQNRNREPRSRSLLGVLRGLVASGGVAVLCAELPHPADAAADLAGNAGLAQPGHPADQEAMAAPLDARVHDRVEPDRQQQNVLDRAEEQVSRAWGTTAQPAGLDGVAHHAQADQDRSPPQAIPESPENAQTSPTVARLAIGSARNVESAIWRRILYHRE